MTTTNPITEAAVRIARAAHYGFVTTHGPDGIETRMVQHLDIADDLTVTFSTAPHTRKANTIRSNPRVSYAVFDANTRAAATIYGSAHLIYDTERSKQLWTDDLAPFFPDGPTGEDFILVEINADRIEVWSVPDELAPEPFGLNSATAQRDGNEWSKVPGGTHP